MLKERIKNLCKKKGISMSQVEKDLEFARGYLSKLDVSTPNMKKMQKIADYFGVTIEYLMKGDENGNAYVVVDIEHQILVNAMNNVKPENIQLALDFLKKLS